MVLEEFHLHLISRTILEQFNLILGNAGRLCNHLYNMYCHSAAWILPRINMAVFCQSTQQVVLKGTYDICYVSNASFAVIWLAGAVRCEVLATVTGGHCLQKYRCDITRNTV